MFWPPDHQTTGQTTTYPHNPAQVVLNASVVHLAAAQYVPLERVDWKILSIRKWLMLNGFSDSNAFEHHDLSTTLCLWVTCSKSFSFTNSLIVKLKTHQNPKHSLCYAFSKSRDCIPISDYSNLRLRRTYTVTFLWVVTKIFICSKYICVLLQMVCRN